VSIIGLLFLALLLLLIVWTLEGAARIGGGVVWVIIAIILLIWLL
jgi:hypothetical protein